MAKRGKGKATNINWKETHKEWRKEAGKEGRKESNSSYQGEVVEMGEEEEEKLNVVWCGVVKVPINGVARNNLITRI